jgi:hypothetical protein
MADERFPSPAAAEDSTREGRPRGGRPQGGRDSGGFRIRLSDNEMQAARALQEAFGLRSTVAVLGFSLRAMAQQLEQGQLDALISQHRAQESSRSPADRSERRSEHRGERGEGRRDGGRSGGGRVDPFARPSRPAAAPQTEADLQSPEASETDGLAGEGDAIADAALADTTSEEAAVADAAGMPPAEEDTAAPEA